MTDKFAAPVESGDQVEDYLVASYECSEEHATDLVKKYDALLQEGIKRASFIYYVGDQIADEEMLEEKELDESYFESEEGEHG